MYSNKNERANNKSKKKNVYTGKDPRFCLQRVKDTPEKQEQQYKPEKYAPQDPDEFLNIACI